MNTFFTAIAQLVTGMTFIGSLLPRSIHSTDVSMIHREYGWNGLKCPHCNGLLPATSGLSSTCTDCSVTTQIRDIVKVPVHV